MAKNDKILLEELVVNGDLKNALDDLHSIAKSQEKIASSLESLSDSFKWMKYLKECKADELSRMLLR